MKVKKNKLFIAIFILSTFLIISFVALFLFQKINNLKESFNKGILITPLGISSIEEYETKEQNELNILHYLIDIELLPEKKEIAAEVLIKGVPNKKDLSKIVLNFYDNFIIDTLYLNNENTEFSYKNNLLSIYPVKTILDTFQIRIKYHGSPLKKGFGSFIFGESDSTPVIYSINEPIFASTWFPCNDTPSDKVLTDIIITADSILTSVSNGILIKKETIGIKKSYHWKTIYPISTYLISIYSSDYNHFSDNYISSKGDTMTLDYFVLPENFNKAKVDFSIHPEAIKIFAELFGEYPFINEKYGVAEFLWNSGAMENQTITGIGSKFINGNKFYTSTLVHELAHHWWGNSVTLSSWKDIWLNEGFATYSEALYYEKIGGYSALQSTMNSFRNSFGNSELYNPKNLFSRAVYNKGAWLLHMLRRNLGDTIFFNVLRSFQKKFKYKNASSQDFISLAESISNKNLSQFFNQWLFEGKGMIKIEYDFTSFNNTSKFVTKVHLKQVQEGYLNYHFPLDIEFIDNKGNIFKQQFYINNNDTLIKFHSNNIIEKIILDPECWLASEFFKKESN